MKTIGYIFLYTNYNPPSKYTFATALLHRDFLKNAIKFHTAYFNELVHENWGYPFTRYAELTEVYNDPLFSYFHKNIPIEQYRFVNYTFIRPNYVLDNIESIATLAHINNTQLEVITYTQDNNIYCQLSV